jgi:hypothetical protein
MTPPDPMTLLQRSNACSEVVELILIIDAVM